jgi:hypothetical protein
MADPEIELPVTSSQVSLDAKSPGISRARQGAEIPVLNASDLERGQERSDGDEKDEKEDDVESEEVVYHYLTFGTDLPPPTTIFPTSDDQDPPPEAPNLAKYQSPFEWSNKRKNIIIWVSCIITALTAFTAGAYSPGVGQMTEEWHVSNVAALVGITMFTTGMYTYELRGDPVSDS